MKFINCLIVVKTVLLLCSTTMFSMEIDDDFIARGIKDGLSREQASAHVNNILHNRKAWEASGTPFMDIPFGRYVEYLPEHNTLVTYLDERLGAGEHGSVYGAYIHWSDVTADKFCAYKKAADDDEFRMQSMFNHPNILKCHFQNVYNVITMEYMETNLKRLISMNDISYQLKLEIALQIALGVQEMHRQGVVHQDLDSSNILVSRTEKGLVVKIGDFGSAENVSVKSKKNISPDVASPFQMQHLFEKKDWAVNTADDIWGLGLLFNFINLGTQPSFTKINPYKESHADYLRELDSFRLGAPSRTSFEMLINSLLTPNYDITITQVVDFLKQLKNNPGNQVSVDEISSLKMIAPKSPESKRFYHGLSSESRRYYYDECSRPCPRCFPNGTGRYYHDQLCKKCRAL